MNHSLYQDEILKALPFKRLPWQERLAESFLEEAPADEADDDGTSMPCSACTGHPNPKPSGPSGYRGAMTGSPQASAPVSSTTSSDPLSGP